MDIDLYCLSREIEETYLPLSAFPQIVNQKDVFSAFIFDPECLKDVVK